MPDDPPSSGGDVIELVDRRFPRYRPLPEACSDNGAAAARAALRRAELRIAQLEHSLEQALRDSAVNWARARRAERRLKEVERLDPAR